MLKAVPLVFIFFLGQYQFIHSQETDHSKSSFLIDSVIVFPMNLETNMYDTSTKYIYKYNSARKNTTKEIYNWDGQSWKLNANIVKQFDGKGNILFESHNWYEIKKLTGTTKITYRYNSNGKMTNKLERDRDLENGKWINYQQDIYTYDTKGNMESMREQEWEENKWMDTFIRNYFYNSKGYMVSETMDRWQNNVWEKVNKRTYINNDKGNPTNEISEMWKNDRFVNWYQILNQYNEQGAIVYNLYQTWTDENWIDNSRYFVSFDANGNIISEVFEDWHYNEWMEVHEIRNEYDYTGLFLNEIMQDWSYSKTLNEKQKCTVYFHQKK